MLLRDPNLDALAVKMLSALEGDGVPWRRLNLALRDAIMEHAVHTTPYYRRVVAPGTPFEEAPILTKSLVRAHGRDLLSREVPPERRVLLESTGSADTRLARFCRDTTQGPAEYVSGQRALRELQGIPEHAVMVWVATAPVADPHDRPPRFSRARRHRPPVLPVSSHGLDRAGVGRLLRRCATLAPYFLYGHPSALHRVADGAEEGGLPVPPVAVVGTGETLTGDGRSRLGRALRAPVHSWYGSNEVGGYVAGTLPGERRFVFNPLLAHVELLDGSGRPAAPGSRARIVVTDLNNYVMPFIRYQLGDVTTVPDPGRAWVGGWRASGPIVGRAHESLRLPGGRRLTPVELGDLFLSERLAAHVRRWQCAQTGPAEVELRVVWEPPGPPDEVRETVARRLDELVGPGASALIRDVPELDRLPSGKAWVIRREDG